MNSIDIWALREEARELWDYVISDELTYFSEASHRDLEFSHVLSKKYLDGDFWFEIHWTLVKLDQREMHFNCICEASKVSLPSLKLKADSKRVRVTRNRPVFVHAPELIKLPEGVIPESVPSVIRLKLVEFACHCGWKEAEALAVIPVVQPGNGKLNSPFLSFGKSSSGIKMSQSPSQLIESRTQTTNKIADEHGDEFWSNFVLNPADVDGLIEIVMVGDDVRLRVNPVLDGHFKRIEVKLRPAGFHIYIDQPRRNSHRAALAECGTIGA
ncbi:MAG TPA: hypothetical protein VKH45_12330 [Candidatus Acidoferrum sp.]|nr:hypothetical protein [Candidatus Acidoferrum sp.]